MTNFFQYFLSCGFYFCFVVFVVLGEPLCILLRYQQYNIIYFIPISQFIKQCLFCHETNLEHVIHSTKPFHRSMDVFCTLHLVFKSTSSLKDLERESVMCNSINDTFVV